MYSNAMSPKSMNVVFMRIDFAIKKDLTAQLVARLPSGPALGMCNVSYGAGLVILGASIFFFNRHLVIV